ncbi:MAG: cell wall hydrolase [Alphaproteobacteria bacterium]|nr:cell wall hydrolase [Alphaproteobacteria bacterium]
MEGEIPTDSKGFAAYHSAAKVAIAHVELLIPLRCVPKEESDAAQFYKELEIDVLARTLWGEARSEGVQGMEAVACVVLNRVEVARKMAGYWWGNNTIQVCQKAYQFSCWNKSDPQYRRVISDPQYRRVISVTEKDVYFATCMRVARRALWALIDDPTNGATHYHGDYVNPVWADINKKTKIIGRHIFYKLVEV